MATIDGTNKKLSVSGEQIEESVGKSHEHSNKTVLDKLSDNNGTLQYNGSDITGGGSSEGGVDPASVTSIVNEGIADGSIEVLPDDSITRNKLNYENLIGEIFYNANLVGDWCGFDLQINNITGVTNGTSVLKLSFNVDRRMDNVQAQAIYLDPGYTASAKGISYTEKGDGTYDCEASITLKSIPQKARVYFNGTTNARVKGIFKNFNITIDDVAVDFTIITQDYFTCSKQENFKLTTNKDFTDKVTEINSTIRDKRNVVSKNQLKNLELAYSLDFSDVRKAKYFNLWSSWLNSGVLELPDGKNISDSRSPSLDTFKLLLEFKVADTNTIVRFSGGGQTLTVDFTDNKLKVKPEGSTVKEVAVDFMTIETIYTLNLVKNATSLSMTLCDKTTGKSYTIETTTNYMTGFGNITTAAIGGTVYIYDYKFYLPFIRTNPTWFFGGDSITQGAGVTDISNRWCSRILEKYCDGDGIIWGKGYDKASSMLTRIQAIYDLGYKPKNVVIMIGTNDSSDSTSGYDLWVSNIDSMIELITTNGGNPIFCVPPMKNTEKDNNIIFQMRDYLLSKPYKVIRMDLATSVDGVGVTQDTSLFISDKLHPNDAGNLKMYERFLLDIGDGIVVEDKKEVFTVNAENIYFADGESLQYKLDNGKLGGSVTS